MVMAAILEKSEKNGIWGTFNAPKTQFLALNMDVSIFT